MPLLFLDRGEHAAQADLYHAEVVDLVDLDLGIQFSALFEDAAHLVRRDRIDAAPEGHELHDIHVRMARRILGGAVQPRVVRPLVEHVDAHPFAAEIHRVLRQHRNPQRGEQLADAVVDLGVDVVRPPRQHDDGFSFLARGVQDLVPFRADVLAVPLQPRKARAQTAADHPRGEPVLFQRLFQRAHRRVLVVRVYVRRDEVAFIQPLVVRAQKFGVVRHDGAVVMVIRIAFVEVVAFAGEEDKIDALVEQAFDVPVREFCGVADGIARDGVLPFEIELPRRLFAQYDVEAAFLEEPRPQRELFVEPERERQSDLAARRFFALCGGRRLRGRQQAPVFVGVDVQLVGGGLAPRAALAFVARNELAPVRKSEHVHVAVGGTAAAHPARRMIGEIFQLRLADDGAPALHVLLGVQRGAERAHQPRDARAHDLFARFQLEGTQHRVVQEGAALHEDVLAQLVRRFGADDLVDRVFHDGGGEPRGDVLHGRALLLRLFDGAVHEHRAAAAQLNGMFREQPELGKFVDLHAHRPGEGLDEGTAARGARLVEHDRVDRAVLDLETLDVLPADVDDEIGLRVEIQRGFEVRDRFDDAEIRPDRRLHHIFAVARDRRAADADAPARKRIDLAQAF